MRTGQIIDMYQSHGLKDGQLKNMVDLVWLHDFHLENVKGFDRLTEGNQTLFKEFILNFHNGWGLQARSSIKDMSVYIGRNIDYNKLSDWDGKLCDFGVKSIYQIFKDGEWQNIEVDDEPPSDDEHTNVKTSHNYFRFNYTCQECSSWAKIESSTSWG